MHDDGDALLQDGKQIYLLIEQFNDAKTSFRTLRERKSFEVVRAQVKCVKYIFYPNPAHKKISFHHRHPLKILQFIYNWRTFSYECFTD